MACTVFSDQEVALAHHLRHTLFVGAGAVKKSLDGKSGVDHRDHRRHVGCSCSTNMESICHYYQTTKPSCQNDGSSNYVVGSITPGKWCLDSSRQYSGVIYTQTKLFDLQHVLMGLCIEAQLRQSITQRPAH